MSTPKKKTTTKKKPVKAARPIPPPPPGWEIVGKDDPRLKNLPCRPMACYPKIGEWFQSIYGEGDFVTDKTDAHYALPIAQPPAPQPPMIRLRLPSEKPTMEDGDEDECIVVFKDNGPFVQGWDDEFEYVIAWLPGRLPDGILPREPSQEEKWRAEFEEEWASKKGYYSDSIKDDMWAFFLAAKGGAE